MILITGGMGFIGTYLVNILGDEDIIIVDNLSTSMRSPDIYKDRKNIRVIIDDLINYVPDCKIDQVYHLASIVGPVAVLNNNGYIANNVISDLYHIIDICNEHGSNLLDVSTAEAYGPNPGSFNESDFPIVSTIYSDRLEYAVSKLLSEIILHNSILNFNYNIVRPFNVVGVGQNDESGFVIPRFIKQAINDLDITVFYDGLQERCFTSAFDVAEGMKKIMNSSINGEIFNLGNPNNKISMNDLAIIIKNKLNSNSKIKNIDPKTIFPKYEEAFRKLPNMDKLNKLFNWKPEITLDWILDDSIRGYLNNYEII